MKASIWLCVAIFFGLSTICLSTGRLRAERPTAPRLLPADTVAYVRIVNVPELVERFGDTAMGRITSDEQVKPFVGDLYRSAAEAFARIEDRVGLPLDQLLAIPQGEVCIAIVAPEKQRPELIVLLEVGDHLAAAQKLIEAGEAAFAQQGGARSTTRAGETELVIYDPPGDRERRAVMFEREGVLALTSNEDLARQLLQVWDGKEDVRTLSDDRRFTTIMRRSRGFKDEPPQITFYADPITLVKRATRGNFSAQAGLSIMDGLGLDGVKAVGGSMIFATEEFDSVVHLHVMMQNPRDGVLKMIAFESGKVTPEPWVPRDAASYTTFHWNIEQTYDELVKLYNTFRGEEAWKLEIVERVSEGLGIDLQEDVVEALDGRATIAGWMERPARINSQANLLALKLKDPEKTEKALARVASRFGNVFESETYGGVKYYRVKTNRRQRDQELDNEITRRPTPCLAILGDYLVGTDSVKFLEQAIVTKSDRSLSLANELDFKLIANKIDRQLGETNAGLITFNRPEEGFRMLYELATAKSTQSRLATQAEDNRFFGALNNALTKNPLPPFAVLAQYLAPGGGLITDDETGIHYTAFSLRRE